jgi:hypothetical protein
MDLIGIEIADAQSGYGRLRSNALSDRMGYLLCIAVKRVEDN